ncbi:MAG: nitroreductase family protein [Candidatus Humimicrobiaceae bacterium]
MEYQKSVIDLIKERRSCRSFIEKEIEPDKVQKIDSFITNMNSAIDIKTRFLLVKRGVKESNKAERLGTYGFISGASSFIVGVIDRDEKKVEAFGHYFEKIILYATDIGLGTCWLGGSFSRSDFEQKVNLSSNELIPIVSPVGYARSRRKIMDSVVRTIANSNNRKPWNEIFFDTNSSSPLAQSSAGEYKLPLEMVRIAPSASNKQPWRIIMDKDGYNFYLLRTKGYKLRNFDIQRSDLGIVMCHFELAVKELKLKGAWQINIKDKKSEELEYITTWVPDEKIIP